MSSVAASPNACGDVTRRKTIPWKKPPTIVTQPKRFDVPMSFTSVTCPTCRRTHRGPTCTQCEKIAALGKRKTVKQERGDVALSSKSKACPVCDQTRRGKRCMACEKGITRGRPVKQDPQETEDVALSSPQKSRAIQNAAVPTPLDGPAVEPPTRANRKRKSIIATDPGPNTLPLLLSAPSTHFPLPAPTTAAEIRPAPKRRKLSHPIPVVELREEPQILEADPPAQPLDGVVLQESPLFIADETVADVSPRLSKRAKHSHPTAVSPASGSFNRPRPSTRLSTLHEHQATAQQIKVEPAPVPFDVQELNALGLIAMDDDFLTSKDDAYLPRSKPSGTPASHTLHITQYLNISTVREGRKGTVWQLVKPPKSTKPVRNQVEPITPSDARPRIWSSVSLWFSSQQSSRAYTYSRGASRVCRS